MSGEAGSPVMDRAESASRRRVRLPAIRAEGGDHAAIYYFLQGVFQGPSRSEFHSQLEDPFYEPYDRLLLRRERRVAAHVHITHRTMHLGPMQVPVAGLAWLGVVPEYRHEGLGTHLLRAAESQMEASGALIGVLQTSIPHFFRRTGWALCGQASYRRANARTLLARLLDRGPVPRSKRRLHIRRWLQWEQDALSRIYGQNTTPTGGAADGALERTDAYWQWLLKRHAQDEVYVALEGPEQLELGERSTRVVGYVVTRGEQILELMTAPDRSGVAADLLARCCRDAIEHDRHCVLLHAPPSCPLFNIFEEAAGCGATPRAEHAEVTMMRLLDGHALLRRMHLELDRRAREAALSRPFDLGLLVEGRKFQIELGREGVAVTVNRVGRSYLRLNIADFTRLVLGRLDFDAALGDGRLECSTALAQETGRALFPSRPLWHPPWDNMPNSALEAV